MIAKIGEWIIKWQSKVMIGSWTVLNDKLVLIWRWYGESSGKEDGDLGKNQLKKTKMKLLISKYTQVRSVN